jgi:hypothetical protein
MKKLTLREMILLARKKGGECLSTSYLNSATALLWRCSASHRWTAVPASIRKGSWCPECAGVRRTTLAELQHIAASRGGSCLSPVCRNSVAKLRWRCSEGHEWIATPSQVKRGHWCPFCARIVSLTPQDLRWIAVSRGGECLSPKLKTSSDLARWECAFGHIWQTRVKSIQAGHWCPVCADNRILTIDEMQQIARERGGKCLSRNYKNGRTPLIWECVLGHRWRASPANVKSGTWKRGTWCPECYNARRRFHQTHDIEFTREIAFSRQGRCLSTQYLGSKSKLTWECGLGHSWQAIPASVLQGTWCPVCAHNQRLRLSELQDIATSRGGTCLSREYVNERTRLRWQCSAGHIWTATPQKVKRGSWCPTCARYARRSQWVSQQRKRRTLRLGHVQCRSITNNDSASATFSDNQSSAEEITR